MRCLTLSKLKFCAAATGPSPNRADRVNWRVGGRVIACGTAVIARPKMSDKDHRKNQNRVEAKLPVTISRRCPKTI